MGGFKPVAFTLCMVLAAKSDIFGNMRTSEHGRSTDFKNRMKLFNTTKSKVCLMHSGFSKTNTLTFTYIDLLWTKYI